MLTWICETPDDSRRPHKPPRPAAHGGMFPVKNMPFDAMKLQCTGVVIFKFGSPHQTSGKCQCVCHD